MYRAWLGLKALAWAWLWWARAFKILSQARIEGLFTIYGYNCQKLQNGVKKRQTMAKQYVMYNNKIHNIVVIFEAQDKHLTKYKELTKKKNH